MLPTRPSNAATPGRGVKRRALGDIHENLAPHSALKKKKPPKYSATGTIAKTPKAKNKHRSTKSGAAISERKVSWGLPNNYADTKTPRISNRAARPNGTAAILGQNELQHTQEIHGQKTPISSGKGGRLGPATSLFLHSKCVGAKDDDSNMDIDSDTTSVNAALEDTSAKAASEKRRPEKDLRGDSESAKEEYRHYNPPPVERGRFLDLEHNPQSEIFRSKPHYNRDLRHHLPDNAAVLEVVNGGPLGKPSRKGPLSGLQIGGRATRLVNSLDEDDVTLDSVLSDSTGVPEETFEYSYTKNLYNLAEPEPEVEEDYDSVVTNQAVDLASAEPWTDPDGLDDERSLTSTEFFFAVNGKSFSHPPLPPGWTVRMSKAHNRPIYSHPERGSTFSCPVVLPVPLKSRGQRNNFGIGNAPSMAGNVPKKQRGSLDSLDHGIFQQQPALHRQNSPSQPSTANAVVHWPRKELTTGELGSIRGHYPSPAPTTNGRLQGKEEDVYSLATPSPSKLKAKVKTPEGLKLLPSLMKEDILASPSPSEVKTPEGLKLPHGQRRASNLASPRVASSDTLSPSEQKEENGEATHPSVGDDDDMEISSDTSGLSEALPLGESRNSSASDAEKEHPVSSHLTPKDDQNLGTADEEHNDEAAEDVLVVQHRQARNAKNEAAVQNKPESHGEPNDAEKEDVDDCQPFPSPSDDDRLEDTVETVQEGESPSSTKSGDNFPSSPAQASQNSDESSVANSSAKKGRHHEDGSPTSDILSTKSQDDNSIVSGHTEKTTPTILDDSGPGHSIDVSPCSEDSIRQGRSNGKEESPGENSARSEESKSSTALDEEEEEEDEGQPMEELVVSVAAHAASRKKGGTVMSTPGEVADKPTNDSPASSNSDFPPVNLDEAMFPDLEDQVSEIGSPTDSIESMELTFKRRRDDPATPALKSSRSSPSSELSSTPSWFDLRPDSLQRVTSLPRRGKYKCKLPARPGKYSFLRPN